MRSMLFRSAVLCTGVVVLPQFASAQCDPVWTPFTGTGPGPRFTSGIAHDHIRGIDVLYGGTDDLFATVFKGDTWEFNRATRTWSERATTGPQARYGNAAVFVPTLAGGSVLLFGGSTIAEGVGVQNDTWRWDGTSWIQLFPAASPSPRYGSNLAYDSARDRVVLFGGLTAGNARNNETWEFDGATWNFISSGGPQPRGYAGLTYHAARGRTLLFGGNGTNGIIGDTWEWDGAIWTQIFPAAAPAPRLAPVLAYDPTTQQAILLGGLDGGTHADLWAYGNTWVQQTQPANNPGGRAGAQGAMSPGGELMIMGGWTGSATAGDTWFFECQPAAACYANCDESTVPPILNVADFTCFLQRFAAGDAYANCDESTVPPVLNVADFTCFLQKFAAGCN